MASISLSLCAGSLFLWMVVSSSILALRSWPFSLIYRVRFIGKCELPCLMGVSDSTCCRKVGFILYDGSFKVCFPFRLALLKMALEFLKKVLRLVDCYPWFEYFSLVKLSAIIYVMVHVPHGSLIFPHDALQLFTPLDSHWLLSIMVDTNDAGLD